MSDSDSDGCDTFVDAAEWTANYPDPDATATVTRPTHDTTNHETKTEAKVETAPTNHKPGKEGEGGSPAASYMVTNMKTGEICALKDVPDRFPEAAMSLRNFDPASSGVEASDPSSCSGRSTGTDNPDEMNMTKTEKLGFRGMMKSQVKKKLSELKKFSSSRTATAVVNSDGTTNVKVKVKKKTTLQLSELREIQCLHLHNGPIWAFAFSDDGVFMASVGADSVVRVWVVKNTEEGKKHATAVLTESPKSSDAAGSTTDKDTTDKDIFHPVPYRTYYGHKADVIDLAWSKTRFLLSASIDKTVRLWHVSREKCLSIFQHPDLVTSVKFHPREDRFFLSGSFDKRLRIWNIPEHRVVEWQQTPHVITSATFSPSGEQIVIGLYDGQVMFYATQSLKYLDRVDCRNRRGKHRKGKKVTGVVFSPDGKHLLVSTNDSRLRLVDVKDKSVVAKFKGMQNEGLQIRASFGEDGEVISGSDDHHVYLWTSTNDTDDTIISRNEAHESFKVGSATVTCAQLCPRITMNHARPEKAPRHLIIASDFQGQLKIFENTGLPKQLTRSSSTMDMMRGYGGKSNSSFSTKKGYI